MGPYELLQYPELQLDGAILASRTNEFFFDYVYLSLKKATLKDYT